MRPIIAALAIVLAAPAVCAEDLYSGLDGLSWADRSQLEAQIDETVKGGRSNVTIPFSLSPRVSGNITPGFFKSRSTGAICDRCTDFCREFGLEVQIDGGFVTTLYTGERCIGSPATSPRYGAWVDRHPLVTQRSTWLVPAENFKQARDHLIKLQYMADDNAARAQDVLAALEVFRADAELTRPGSIEINDQDLATLRDTERRSQTRASCTLSTAYGACGRRSEIAPQ